MALPSIFTTTQYTFEGKKSYETVLVLLYRHWFILLEQLIAFIILAVLPWVLLALAGPYLAHAHVMSLFWFVVAMYYLCWWYGLAYVVTMYLLDTWIVSDHRVIDSEQQGFFRRTVSELTLSKIQDISVRVKGPIATFLNFGDLVIQTAGTKERFHFKQIPNPQGVKDLIMQAHNEYIKIHKNDQEVHREDL